MPDAVWLASPRVRRFLGLWNSLDRVERQALYDLLVHRVQCRG